VPGCDQGFGDAANARRHERWGAATDVATRGNILGSPYTGRTIARELARVHGVSHTPMGPARIPRDRRSLGIVWDGAPRLRACLRSRSAGCSERKEARTLGGGHRCCHTWQHPGQPLHRKDDRARAGERAWGVPYANGSRANPTRPEEPGNRVGRRPPVAFLVARRHSDRPGDLLQKVTKTGRLCDQ